MAGSKRRLSMRSPKSHPIQYQEVGLNRFGDLGIHTDLRRSFDAWPVRHKFGSRLRENVPHESHGKWTPAKDRPSPLDLLKQSNRGRQAEFIPLRMGRMAASPFAFLRGAASVMAFDLSRTPICGIPVVMCGDAHVNNFGFYGSPQRDLLFDLNDFDETMIGPWEYDLKRLAASLNVAGRENGLNARERRTAVIRCVEGYRNNLFQLQSMGILDVWYRHAYPGRTNPLLKFDAKTAAIVEKAVVKASGKTNRALLQKVGQRDVTGSWTLHEDPPILTHIPDKLRDQIYEGLNAYADTLNPERRYLLGRYHVVDVGHRVVGVGSVGTRAYLALLLGNDDLDPLFLQIKEATAPAHSPYLPRFMDDFRHDGKRIVIGQRALQASSDIFLGWTTIQGRHYFVRQMKNMKGGIPIEWLSGTSFNFYAFACGAILARAHARTSEAAVLAGYCGDTHALDEALADWAEAYGNQTEADHARLVKGIKAGTIKAQSDSPE